MSRAVELLDPLRPDLDDARAARREARSSRGRRRRTPPTRARVAAPGAIGETDRGAAPLQPRVARDDLVEQRASDRGRRRGEGEERACGVGRAERARAAPATSSTRRSAASNESCIRSHPDTNMCSCPVRNALKTREGPCRGPLRSVPEERCLVDGLLELRAGGELRHGRRRMCTFSLGFRGFTPMRAARWVVWNFPKPVKVTESPDLSVSSTVSRNASTAAPASRLERPLLPATASTNSCLVTPLLLLVVFGCNRPRP